MEARLRWLWLCVTPASPSKCIVFSNEYHIKWQPVHRYNIYRRNIQWLKFWLQNEEADDPVDPEQYVR